MNVRDEFNSFRKMFWGSRNLGGKILCLPFWVPAFGFMLLALIQDFIDWLGRVTKK
jgi:hypothetical protein